VSFVDSSSAEISAQRIGGVHKGPVWSDWVDVPDGDGVVAAAFTAGADGHEATTGVSVESLEYRVRGAGATHAWPRIRFPGHYADAETGLNENWHRYYAPGIGRYAQPEPVLSVPFGIMNLTTSGLGWSAYGYAANNPLATVDTSGRFPFLAFAIGFAVGYFIGSGELHWPADNEHYGDPNAPPGSIRNPYGLEPIGMGVNNSCDAEGTANWRSTKQFGHTFNRHGAGARNTRTLIDRARGTRTPQGQWMDNQKAAEFLNGVKVDGPATVRIPDGLGQVIRPDGSIAPASWARVVPGANGFRTAFPILP
jgi:RHS repeat-associated protein